MAQQRGEKDQQSDTVSGQSALYGQLLEQTLSIDVLRHAEPVIGAAQRLYQPGQILLIELQPAGDFHLLRQLRRL